MGKTGRFWSEDGEAAYRRTYEAARALWPVHEVRRVTTQFGTVQALTTGTGDATPVVLLHGMSCTSLMWRPNVQAWAAERPVIAIDSVVDCGGSSQTAPAPDLEAVARSVTQTLDGLGIGRAHLVGLSYGAWTAAGWRCTRRSGWRRPRCWSPRPPSDPRRTRERQKRHLPSAEVRAVGGAGHMVSIDDPAATNRIVAEFLRRHDG